MTRKTTVEIPPFLLAKDEKLSRLECKYAVKTDPETTQNNNLEQFLWSK